jgi:hypothetical protein
MSGHLVEKMNGHHGGPDEIAQPGLERLAVNFQVKNVNCNSNNGKKEWPEPGYEQPERNNFPIHHASFFTPLPANEEPRKHYNPWTNIRTGIGDDGNRNGPLFAFFLTACGQGVFAIS